MNIEAYCDQYTPIHTDTHRREREVMLSKEERKTILQDEIETLKKRLRRKEKELQELEMEGVPVSTPSP